MQLDERRYAYLKETTAFTSGVCGLETSESILPSNLSYWYVRYLCKATYVSYASEFQLLVT